MKTIGRCAVALTASLALVSLAHAQQCSSSACGHSDCREEFWNSYMQGAMWPTQYVQAPRNSICSTFEIMARNGWRRQNLLGQYHFKAGTGELTDAGRLKAHWVLTQAPVERRTVFIERAPSDEETAKRVAAVQDWSSGNARFDGKASISETDIVDVGRPAQAVDAVFTGWAANQPAPILPPNGGSSSGGSE
ncbi:MAG: hypothetical protein KDA61_13485 [Planctomycetales bacterium]|nr:hypothetical protein [Planctomycetales bacterium]